MDRLQRELTAQKQETASLRDQLDAVTVINSELRGIVESVRTGETSLPLFFLSLFSPFRPDHASVSRLLSIFLTRFEWQGPRSLPPTPKKDVVRDLQQAVRCGRSSRKAHIIFNLFSFLFRSR